MQGCGATQTRYFCDANALTGRNYCLEKEDQVSVFSGVIEEDICLWNKCFYSSAVELTLSKKNM